MTYTNNAAAFNQACTDIEAAAGVTHYFEILSNPDTFPQFVAEAEQLDAWDCFLLECEDELA